VKKLIDCVNTDNKSLIKLVKVFLNQGEAADAEGGGGVVDEDEDQADQQQDNDGGEPQISEMPDNEDGADVCDHLN